MLQKDQMLGAPEGRRQKHVEINDQLERYECYLDNLQMLISEIVGDPASIASNGDMSRTSQDVSYSEVLNGASVRLSDMNSRFNDLTNAIREILF